MIEGATFVNCLHDGCDWMNLGDTFEVAKELAEEHEAETTHPVQMDIEPGSEEWDALFT